MKNLKKIIASIATISILGMGAVPAQAQEAGSHVKVGTYNNSTTEGYVHGNGAAYSHQTGGIHIQGGGNSTAGYEHSGAPGAHGGYGFSGGYGFQRGASVTGTGSFGLREATNFGAEGSSWTQLKW